MIFTAKDGTLTAFGEATEKWAEAKSGAVLMKEMTKSDIRSLDQNRLAWVWYRQIEEFMHEPAGWGHNYCKLTIGVPILRAESEKFRDLYDRYLRPMTYEAKLEAIELVDVTKAMTTKQMTTYLETIQRKFAFQGLELETLEDV